MTFFGLPPFLPLARAAATFAAVVAFPPFLPIATACGFLATGGTRLGVEPQVQRAGGGVAVALGVERDRRAEGVRAASVEGVNHRLLGARAHGVEGGRGVGVRVVRHHEDSINPNVWDVNTQRERAA